VGLVLALEVSPLARSSADWHQLLDLCALTGTLIAHRLVLRNVVDDLVKAQRQKSPNMISAFGRYPDMASPAETSAIAASLTGVARTRVGKWVLSPRLTLKAPP
jgi:hypothetical protein